MARDTLSQRFINTIVAHPGHANQKVHGHRGVHSRSGYATRVAKMKSGPGENAVTIKKSAGKGRVDSSVSPGMRSIAESHARHPTPHSVIRAKMKNARPERVGVDRLAPGNLISMHIGAKRPSHEVLATGPSPNGKGITEFLVRPVSGSRSTISSEHWAENRDVTRFA